MNIEEENIMSKKMDSKLFRAIKIMTAGGGSINEIAEYFDISKPTVQYVRRAENMDEYHAILAAKYAKRRSKAQGGTEQNAELATEADATNAAKPVPGRNDAQKTNASVGLAMVPMAGMPLISAQHYVADQHAAQAQGAATAGKAQSYSPAAQTSAQPSAAPQVQVIEHRQSVTVQATH